VAQLLDQALDGNAVESVLKCIKIADSRICCSPTKAIKSSTSESAATFLSRFSASWVYSKVSFLSRAGAQVLICLQIVASFCVLILQTTTLTCAPDFIFPLICFSSCIHLSNHVLLVDCFYDI
jgi:hypothetical protein